MSHPISPTSERLTFLFVFHSGARRLARRVLCRNYLTRTEFTVRRVHTSSCNERACNCCSARKSNAGRIRTGCTSVFAKKENDRILRNGLLLQHTNFRSKCLYTHTHTQSYSNILMYTIYNCIEVNSKVKDMIIDSIGLRSDFSTVTRYNSVRELFHNSFRPFHHLIHVIDELLFLKG